MLALASLAGLLMFLWPLLVRVRVRRPGARSRRSSSCCCCPVVIVVCLAEFTEGGMDSKVLAMLGVLTAINAVMRGLSAGMAGIELVFFLLILGGRVFGAGFGFVLGCTSLFASALLTAGVGPWLPFQMLASAWVGMGAGLLPRRVRGAREIAMLVVYGIVAAYAFGLRDEHVQLAVHPRHRGARATPAACRSCPARRCWRTCTASASTRCSPRPGSWDTGRAITNTVALVVLGPAVLTTLRRAVRRATVTQT